MKGQQHLFPSGHVDFLIGGHVNVLSDYKETGPENFNFNTITAVM